MSQFETLDHVLYSTNFKTPWAQYEPSFIEATYEPNVIAWKKISQKGCEYNPKSPL